MDEIKDVLAGVLHDLMKKQKGEDFAKTLQTWKRIVGPKAYPHTKIVHLTKDRIRVNVNSSAWLYELNLKKERIQRALNKALKIREVNFRLGEVDREGLRRYGRS